MTLLAIYAVALHTILLGFAPIDAAAAAASDPFTVICHSVTPSDNSGDQTDHLLPGQACEHCNLCSTAAAPAAPDIAIFAIMAPMRLSHRLVPVSAPAGNGIAAGPRSSAFRLTIAFHRCLNEIGEIHVQSYLLCGPAWGRGAACRYPGRARP